MLHVVADLTWVTEKGKICPDWTLLMVTAAVSCAPTIERLHAVASPICNPLVGGIVAVSLFVTARNVLA